MSLCEKRNQPKKYFVMRDRMKLRSPARGAGLNAVISMHNKIKWKTYRPDLTSTINWWGAACHEPLAERARQVQRPSLGILASPNANLHN